MIPLGNSSLDPMCSLALVLIEKIFLGPYVIYTMELTTLLINLPVIE